MLETVEKSATNIPEPFVMEPMPMRKRQAVPVSNNQYRVVGDNGEHKDVVANTAYEAFKLAGMVSAIKIERLANARLLVVGQSYFLTDVAEEAAKAAQAEMFDPVKVLKNPVLSADDLDKVMRSFNEQATRNAEVAQEEIEQDKPVAAGTEVHNDGFDEIIPINSPAKAAEKPVTAAPAIEAKVEAKVETPQADPEVPPVPEKALSAEEVDKLLNESKP